MQYNRIVSLVLGSFLFICSVGAQNLEVGLMLGGSNYSGDLGADNIGQFMKKTRPAGGLFLRYGFSNFLSAKVGFNYARVTGDDYDARDEMIRQRNLHFQSNIFEFGATIEYNILGFNSFHMSRTFSPYVFAGVSLFSYKPVTDYQGDEVELQPLGTEGQGMPGFDSPYDLTGFNIPFGIGVRYALSDTWQLGLEIGARKLFTDYLDDVGGAYVENDQLAAGNGTLAAALGNRTGEYLDGEPIPFTTGTARGNDKENDWYYILGVSISYSLVDNGLVGTRGARRNKRGCKTY